MANANKSQASSVLSLDSWAVILALALALSVRFTTFFKIPW